jgi:WD40 repeat protein
MGLAAAAWILIGGFTLGVCRGDDWTSTSLELTPETDWRDPPVVSALALHPDGQLLAIAGDDHWIRIWDLSTGQPVKKFVAHNDWVRTLAFSPHGDLLASAGSDGRIVLWDARRGVRLREAGRMRHTVAAIAFQLDGAKLFSVGFGDKLRVFNPSTGNNLMALNCPCMDMRALAYSADRHAIAVGGRNGIIRILDAQNGALLQEYTAHNRRVRGLAFSPGGEFLASCGEDGKLHVMPLEGGEKDFTLQCPRAKLMSLAFCETDQLAGGGSDNLIHIWDLHRRAELAELPGHTGSVACLAYDGNRLVSAGFDTTVRIWKRNRNLAEEPTETNDRVGARENRVELP